MAIPAVCTGRVNLHDAGWSWPEVKWRLWLGFGLQKLCSPAAGPNQTILRLREHLMRFPIGAECWWPKWSTLRFVSVFNVWLDLAAASWSTSGGRLWHRAAQGGRRCHCRGPRQHRAGQRDVVQQRNRGCPAHCGHWCGVPCPRCAVPHRCHSGHWPDPRGSFRGSRRFVDAERSQVPWSKRHWRLGGASWTSSCRKTSADRRNVNVVGGLKTSRVWLALAWPPDWPKRGWPGSAPAECAKWQPAFERTMRAAIPDVVVHSECAPGLWNTSCLGFPGRPAEGLLLQLSEAGVAAVRAAPARPVLWNPCTRCLPLAWTKRWPVRVCALVWDETSRSMAKRRHARCSRSWLPPRFERS